MVITLLLLLPEWCVALKSIQQESDEEEDQEFLQNLGQVVNKKYCSVEFKQPLCLTAHYRASKSLQSLPIFMLHLFPVMSIRSGLRFFIKFEQ